MTRADAAQPGGRIEWEITEAPAWKTIYHGTRDLERGDIDVVAPPEAVRLGPKPKAWSPARIPYAMLGFYRKQIRLEGGFLVDLISKPAADREEIVGFGMKALRTTADTFSWEWFNLRGADCATKLQEGGELRIELAAGAAGLEVASTEFLSDVSLRLKTRRAGCLFGLFVPARTLWRVRILKGSHIRWPLADAAAPAAGEG